MRDSGSSDETVEDDAAAASVLSRASAPDVIVNNAGQMFVGVAEAFTPEEVSSQLDVNLVGVHRVNRAFLPGMRARGTGLIINISSVAGRIGVPFHAVYLTPSWSPDGTKTVFHRPKGRGLERGISGWSMRTAPESRS